MDAGSNPAGDESVLNDGLGRTPKMNDNTLNEAMMRHDNAAQLAMQTRRWMRPTYPFAEGTTRMATRRNLAPGKIHDLEVAATAGS